jgi:anthranilate phosphoribosyltransferase
MKHVAKVRKELGIRTIFNMLGPLVNPAGAQAQLLGVFKPELVETYPYVLKSLGVKRALVVHGVQGIDEISITGQTYANLLIDGIVSPLRLHPAMFGFRTAAPDEIASQPPLESAQLTYELLDNRVKDARYEMILLNAAAAIYLADRALSIEDGIAKAEESIRSGAALHKLRQLVVCCGDTMKQELLWTS